MRMAGMVWLGAGRRLWFFILILVGLDQISKQWMLNLVFTPPRIIEVTNFFNLVPVWNRGISFGFFSNHPEFVRFATIILAGIVIGFLARQLKRYPLLLKFAASAIIAGAAGNMIDRVVYGRVVDFLDFHLVGYHWPAFNIADVAISIGVFLWICAIVSGRDNMPSDEVSDTTTK